MLEENPAAGLGTAVGAAGGPTLLAGSQGINGAWE